MTKTRRRPEDRYTPLGCQPKSYLYLIAGIAIAFYVGTGI
jgi:hypothetical protein